MSLKLWNSYATLSQPTKLHSLWVHLLGRRIHFTAHKYIDYRKNAKRNCVVKNSFRPIFPLWKVVRPLRETLSWQDTVIQTEHLEVLNIKKLFCAVSNRFWLGQPWYYFQPSTYASQDAILELAAPTGTFLRIRGSHIASLGVWILYFWKKHKPDSSSLPHVDDIIFAYKTLTNQIRRTKKWRYKPNN